MMRSMFAGVAGLKAHQVRMDIIGNNIANVNSAGYKSSRVTFQDVLSQTLRAATNPTDAKGGTNPQQIGLGVQLGSIDVKHTQGNTQSTGYITDLAIEGEGFFILGQGANRQYTRAGMFGLDNGTEGNLVSLLNGQRVLGYAADKNGYIDPNSELKSMYISFSDTVTPRATKTAYFSGNLDNRYPTWQNDDDTISRTIQVYDSRGREQTIVVDLKQLGGNGWEWDASWQLVSEPVLMDNGVIVNNGEYIVKNNNLFLAKPTAPMLTGTDVSALFATDLSSMVNITINGESISLSEVQKLDGSGGTAFTIDDLVKALQADLDEEFYGNLVVSNDGTALVITSSETGVAAEITIAANPESFGLGLTAGPTTNTIVRGSAQGESTSPILSGTEVDCEADLTGLLSIDINGQSVTLTEVQKLDGSGGTAFTIEDLVKALQTDIDNTPLLTGAFTISHEDGALVITSSDTGAAAEITITASADSDFLGLTENTIDISVKGSAGSVEQIASSTDGRIFTTIGSDGRTHQFEFEHRLSAGEIVTAFADGGALYLTGRHSLTQGINGAQRVIEFNPNGSFLKLSGDNEENVLRFKPADAEELKVELDFADFTQYADVFTGKFVGQDGYYSGSLESYAIDQEGVIIGSFSNGLTRALGQVALARFANAAGLERTGSTMFVDTPNSGTAQIGAAGIPGYGLISPSSLEMSNVDLSEEFTEMIITQRGFQANSRIITTSDEMLQELVNMKR